MSATQDCSTLGEHRIEALLARERGVLDNAIKRHLARPPKYREDGAITPEIKGIIPPLAGGDFRAVELENEADLAAVESDRPRGNESWSGP